MLTAIIIDDHVMFSESLKAKLEDKLGLVSVVATSNKGEDVFKLVKQHNPDLVIMDYYLPDHDGLHLYRRLLERHSDLKIIVVSAMTKGSAIQKILKLGVKAIVSKCSDSKNFVDAIQHVSQNRSYVCDTLRTGVLDTLSHKSLNPFDELSQREMEVVSFICQGFSSKEMSSKMNISDKTVATYKARVIEKLNIKSEMELFKLALAHDIVSL